MSALPSPDPGQPIFPNFNAVFDNDPVTRIERSGQTTIYHVSFDGSIGDSPHEFRPRRGQVVAFPRPSPQTVPSPRGVVRPTLQGYSFVGSAVADVAMAILQDYRETRIGEEIEENAVVLLRAVMEVHLWAMEAVQPVAQAARKIKKEKTKSPKRTRIYGYSKRIRRR